MTGTTTAMAKAIRPAVTLFITFWLITGIVYPLTVYAASRILFPSQSQGSLIYDKNGRVTGSKLIGQPFSEDRYFWPRPSMSADHPYNPLASGGSNLGATSKILMAELSDRTGQLTGSADAPEIPSDLVMASASGLDPHISPDSARIQASRVAKARGMDLTEVDRLIEANTEEPILGILGQERVNVLMLNRALDGERP